MCWYLPDFFDADIYPKISFTSTYIEKLDDKKFAIHGDLTNQYSSAKFGLSLQINNASGIGFALRPA
ncbi:YceI family protein [Lysinibacillus sp. NPDC058147]|uniref:YceI family protein n=1 Tax=unclassified Lysinibacillus TaxID=2636778 RepID=UPI0036DF6D09